MHADSLIPVTTGYTADNTGMHADSLIPVTIGYTADNTGMHADSLIHVRCDNWVYTAAPPTSFL